MTKNKRAPHELLPHLDDFLLSLQTNNYSPETVYNYERDLQVLADFLKELKLPFAKLDKKGVERYKAYLTSVDRRTSAHEHAEKRLRSYSINRMLSSLRAFLRYLIAMDLPTPLPTRR
ncbi:MAG: site-specific integrase [Candidatus Veblenbacteria bacterium]|nr:site-specific integrase [Candidatus Veblenbacteria bacterium]